MKKFYIEMTAGIFVLLGLVCLGYLSIHMGVVDLQGKGAYEVKARFSQIGELRPGGRVVIAGVRVGKVESIELKDFVAHVNLRIRSDVELPADTMASIRTRGLIGEQFISLNPGAARENIEPGGRIRQTEPAIDLHSLIGKYAFGDTD